MLGDGRGTLTSAEGLGSASLREDPIPRSEHSRAFGAYADSSVGGVRIEPHPDAGHPLPMPGGDASDGDRTGDNGTDHRQSATDGNDHNE